MPRVVLFFLIALFLPLALLACGGDPAPDSGDPDPIDNHEENGDSANEIDGDTDDGDADLPDGTDGDGDEQDPDPPGPARLEISPSILTFSNVPVDESTSRIVTVRNLGESPLQITAIQLNEFGVSGSQVFLPTLNWPAFPVTLDRNTFRDFAVIFAPGDPGSFRGEMVIFSDDPETPRLSLRIETISFDGELDGPNRLFFSNLEAGETETLQIALYNRGSTPLELQSLTLSGVDAQAFSFELQGLPSLPGFLERNAFVYVNVTFAPDSTDRHRASLEVASSDPGKPLVSIDLQGNRPTPCLRTPSEVDFGTTNPGNQLSRSLLLLNCSFTRNLEITAIDLVDDGGEVFTLIDPPTLPLTLSPMQTKAISLQANLPGESQYQGTIVIESNDPESENTEINLRIRPQGSGN